MHVGLLGGGGWAGVHLAALAASPHVDRVTLACRNAARRQVLAAQHPLIQQTVADHREVLDDPTIDVVDIVLPHDLHAPLSQAALAAGKHVICEKPGATRLEDFDQSLAVATQNQRRLLVVMNQLYNPLFRTLRAEAERGVIGRPFLSVENSFSRSVKSYLDPRDWRNTPQQAGGGVLIDGGFHMVYRHLDTLGGAGPPVWVAADAPQLNLHADGAPEPSKGEDFVVATVGFAGALRIAWTHGWTLAAPPNRARQSFLAGSDGTLELTDDAQAPLLLHRPGAAPVAIAAAPLAREATVEACLLDYLDALATGREVTRAPVALARQTLAVILAAYESSRTGQRVAL